MASLEQSRAQVTEAYDAGRRVGFAVSALAMSLVAFLSLLGAEKAILAIVLGAVAVRGGRPGTLARRLGIAAMAVSVVFLVTAAVVLALFWGRFVEAIKTLQQLS
jgi:hypothetical protein